VLYVLLDRIDQGLLKCRGADYVKNGVGRGLMRREWNFFETIRELRVEVKIFPGDLINEKKVGIWPGFAHDK